MAWSVAEWLDSGQYVCSLLRGMAADRRYLAWAGVEFALGMDPAGVRRHCRFLGVVKKELHPRGVTRGRAVRPPCNTDRGRIYRSSSTCARQRTSSKRRLCIRFLCGGGSDRVLPWSVHSCAKTPTGILKALAAVARQRPPGADRRRHWARRQRVCLGPFSRRQLEDISQ